MASSDAIVIGEGWISEHYFGTDAKSQSFTARVLDRRKQWEEAKTAGTPTVRSRFTEARAALEAELAAFSSEAVDPERVSELYERLVRILGYRTGGATLARTGPLLQVTTPGIAPAARLVLVEAKPVENVEELLEKGPAGHDVKTLLVPYELEDGTALTSVSRTLTTLMVEEGGPAFALVLAGRWLLVAERERWPEGRYLAVNLQLVAERNDDKRAGEIDRALTIIDAQSLLPDADTGEIWWSASLEESVRHTVGVSQDLRDGVRLSIELIANEVVRRRADAGLDPLPKEEAQPLAVQSLRFLYRILFLLYAEASPELGVLPVGASEYEQGYSLDRLRDLTLVELASPQARSGRHLYESLGKLFEMVDQGHTPPDHKSGESDAYGVLDDGLTFHSLRADLFKREATAHIDDVGLGNEALQNVLRHLLLSKESRGRDRGFISYAELGINQLGAVYEGLMSYTGFFAEEDLFEVAKNGDGSKGSWVVPTTRADGISPSDFVTVEDPATLEKRPVVHERGSFVYRLAGRERQQSASYYTPEVLTKFVVSQALEELLDQDGTTTPAADILELTVCEPALGSGAFAIEAVRQLAEQYLTRRQKELDTRIDPDDYQRTLQQVKAYIALHQVYGVDLNSTAVELAEISLWLDTMVEGLAAPWFGLHLKRGNSLIGARRAVFTRAQVEQKAHLTATPTDVPVSELVENLAAERVAGATAGKIHHFLLPHEGWGSAAEAKEAKELAPEAVAKLKEWRKGIRAKPTKKQLDDLVNLGYRVEVLWQLALRRMQIAEQQIRRDIPVWGAEGLPVGGEVSREEIEASLADENGAYQRLRLVMDAWTAMWFWPLTDHGVEGAKLPTLDYWIDCCQRILGRHAELKPSARAQGQIGLASAADWGELRIIEDNELGFASTWSIADVEREHRWIAVARGVSAGQGFFHWELDFSAAFARGGFDLQVGNPPWVRPRSDVSALLAEGDPWWQLAVRPSQVEMQRRRESALRVNWVRQLVTDGVTEVSAVAEYVGSSANFPTLTGLQPDLYRCFIEHCWRSQSIRGVTSLVHLESHFTDEGAGSFRSEVYSRLRRHWQFINSLMLFEIKDSKRFGVNVYGGRRDAPSFLNASYIYQPSTIEDSLRHDGAGSEPGIKTDSGSWDVRAHGGRITSVTEAELSAWHDVLEEPTVPLLETRMLSTVNRASAAVIQKLATAERIERLGVEFSRGWDESIDRKKGFFENEWGAPSSWEEVILQGPHLYVSNPMYKMPNSTMLHNQDWSVTDLEALLPDAIPVTSYKPTGDRRLYDAAYTHWGRVERRPARGVYRVAWRNMAANSGVRTFYPSLIPPGAAHIHGVSSAGTDVASLATLLVAASSLTSDFLIRSAPKSTISVEAVKRLPLPVLGTLRSAAVLRAARLNCVTDAYAAFWRDAVSQDVSTSWTGGIDYPGRPHLGTFTREWTRSTPLRRASDRHQAQLEIDVIVAIGLGVSMEDLCTTYRTQFPVLYGFDRREYLFDANGRLVPMSVQQVWRKKGDAITEPERTATNASGNTYTYELPFVNLDREADMRQAYAHFEKLLEERS
ncbi:DNA methyltransferase [Rathayibacter sp. AY1F8]|uniref:DNA methyltransferase n=1 Tax=Rathayibacter sp. AY1F8 TaxID=2080562 RepID=UPI000CE7B670|nr:DNA methyltransferase [Rathayibacter sp. AY1F8]PPH16142.1 restriction endonuclease subunit M [Rathayibacter sp. AY1F8]